MSAESEAIPQETPARGTRRIVTKGFAVIPDLICMLMVMDVYSSSYSSGFVAACYPPPESVFAATATRDEKKERRWRLMFYRVARGPRLHLSLKSIGTVLTSSRGRIYR